MMKHNWKLTLWTGVMVLLALPASTYANEESDNRIHITDPALLESKGFEPDATNVYATPEAFAQMRKSSGESVADTEVEAHEAAASDDGQIQGGNGPDAVALIHASEFLPIRVTGTTSYGTSGVEERWCDGGLTNKYLGIFHGLPRDPETVLAGRAWYYDNSDEDITVDFVRMCTPFPPDETEFTILSTSTSSGTPGYDHDFVFNLGDGYDHECVYAVRVALGDGNSCAGNQLRIMKAAFRWELPQSQVFADRFEQQ